MRSNTPPLGSVKNVVLKKLKQNAGASKAACLLVDMLVDPQESDEDFSKALKVCSEYWDSGWIGAVAAVARGKLHGKMQPCDTSSIGNESRLRRIADLVGEFRDGLDEDGRLVNPDLIYRLLSHADENGGTLGHNQKSAASSDSTIQQEINSTDFHVGAATWTVTTADGFTWSESAATPPDSKTRQPSDQLTRAAAPVTYRIIFPVVHLGESSVSSGETPGLLQAIVTIFPENYEIGHRAFLAPWSLHCLGEEKIDGEKVDWFERLNSVVNSTDIREALGLGRDLAMMIELAPLERYSEGNFEPGPIQIMGDSLTLAVLIASWAAQNRMNVYRMAVSAAVDIHGVIDSVGSIEEKAETVKRYAERFPAFRFAVAGRDAKKLTGAQGFEVISLPDQITELVAKDSNSILTDGFHEYRKGLTELREHGLSDLETFFGNRFPDIATDQEEVSQLDRPFQIAQFDKPREWLFCDIMHLEKTVSWLRVQQAHGQSQAYFSSSENEDRDLELVLSIPFDNDPETAARFILAKAAERLDLDGQRDASVDQFVTPLLLPLHATGALTDQLLAGLGRVSNEKEEFATSDEINNALKFFPERLLFIAYSRRSTQHQSTGGVLSDELEVELLVQQFQQFRDDQRPAILFVASDLHHAAMIENIWKDKHSSPL